MEAGVYSLQTRNRGQKGFHPQEPHNVQLGFIGRPWKRRFGKKKEHVWHQDRKHRKRTKTGKVDFMKSGHIFEMLVYLQKK